MATTWVPLSHTPGNFASAMWLMGDGTVLVNLYNSKQLMALHPEATGSYASGLWTSVGNFLLEKEYFSSAVLSDGRLVACGGEYSGTGPARNGNKLLRDLRSNDTVFYAICSTAGVD